MRVDRRAILLAACTTALAMRAPGRGALPDVPTSAEAGVPGYTASAWYGLLAPKGLPSDIRAKLEGAARTALQRPDLLARVKDDGAVASGLGGPEFAAFMAGERKRWGEVIRDANITLGQ